MKIKYLFIIGIFTLLLNSCALNKGYVQYNDKPDDIVTTESLKEFIKKNPNPIVVVRAPNASNSMTELDQNDQLYNVIEKELLKGGFNIKDRSLFNKVIESKTNLSYQELYELTKTDLILELVNIDDNVHYNTNVIYTSEQEKVVSDEYNITRLGANIEFKIIYLKENKLIGSYSFNYSPCTSNNNDCRCAVAYKKNPFNPDYDILPYYNYCKNGETVAYDRVQQDQINEFVKIGINEFLNQLKK